MDLNLPDLVSIKLSRCRSPTPRMYVITQYPAMTRKQNSKISIQENWLGTSDENIQGSTTAVWFHETPTSCILTMHRSTKEQTPFHVNFSGDTPGE